MPSSDRPRSGNSQGERLLTRVVARPVAHFLRIEASGGILLLVGTVVALVWANSAWKSSYADLWETTLSFSLGDLEVSEDIRHWVNDGLMALFFFVVGLEIKREVVTGQLSSPRDAALPAVAALGGMAVPAAVYAAVNVGGAGGAGWGIPMATDIAFALGVLVLLGRRVPSSLKVMLLGLAIVDDIGAIAVIAVFYTDELSLGWLSLAGAGLAAVVALRWARRWHPSMLIVLGPVVWLATFESGVHATIAGVALALLMPGAGSERLEETIHPWTSFVVVPLFALANAGIPLTSDAVSDAAGSAITLGVVGGLIAGKFFGVVGAAALAVRLGVARLPDDVNWLHVAGMAALAGIGFTVSIFVSGLAFDDAALQDEAKLGVLVASAAAAAIGSIILLRASPVDQEEASSAAVSTRNSASSA